ncbi:MAG: 50S ribosomal protein L20 [Candidatus Dojkabacteria bacterium]|nr:MAG: 50S ribosomal protein L20 [Candidatus Dojkabacteria bacterium]
MRIKRGHSKRKSHKKVLKRVKGYRLTYSKLYRRAIEATLHAGQYSFAHRRRRKSQLRSEWIKTISSALSQRGVAYKDFVANLKAKNIALDRKVLSELAVSRPETFDQIVKEVTK